MATKFKRAGGYMFGWSFVGLGVAGMVVPIVPGILLFVIGFCILSCVSPSIKAKVDIVLSKYPPLDRFMKRAEVKIAKYLRFIMLEKV